MLKIYAVSIMVARNVKRQGQEMIERVHTASSYLAEGGMDVEAIAMEDAHRWFPDEKGFYDHTVSMEEVPYEAVRKCVVANEQERPVSPRQRPQQRLRQEPQWEEEEDLRIDHPQRKPRQWEPEDDRSEQGPRQWGAKRNGRSRR